MALRSDTTAGELPKNAIKQKVADIAAAFMATFYQVNLGAWETHEFRTEPLPFRLIFFSELILSSLP